MTLSSSHDLFASFYCPVLACLCTMSVKLAIWLLCDRVQKKYQQLKFLFCFLIRQYSYVYTALMSIWLQLNEIYSFEIHFSKFPITLSINSTVAVDVTHLLHLYLKSGMSLKYAWHEPIYCSHWIAIITKTTKHQQNK